MEFSDYGFKGMVRFICYKWEVSRIKFYRWIFRNVFSNLLKYCFSIEFIFEMESLKKKLDGGKGFDDYSLLNTRLEDAIQNWGMWEGREMSFVDFLIEEIEELYS